MIEIFYKSQCYKIAFFGFCRNEILKVTSFVVVFQHHEMSRNIEGCPKICLKLQRVEQKSYLSDFTRFSKLIE
jgi:hypothetical protein